MILIIFTPAKPLGPQKDPIHARSTTTLQQEALETSASNATQAASTPNHDYTTQKKRNYLGSGTGSKSKINDKFTSVVIINLCILFVLQYFYLLFIFSVRRVDWWLSRGSCIYHSDNPFDLSLEK